MTSSSPPETTGRLFPTVEALPTFGVLLHVGVHKTGTTAIQAALADAGHAAQGAHADRFAQVGVDPGFHVAGALERLGTRLAAMAAGSGSGMQGVAGGKMADPVLVCNAGRLDAAYVLHAALADWKTAFPRSASGLREPSGRV